MVNKAVSLYQSVRINGKWTFRKAPEQRLRKLSEGKYYVSWYEGSKKKMEPVGAEPDVARVSNGNSRTSCPGESDPGVSKGIRSCRRTCARAGQQRCTS